MMESFRGRVRQRPAPYTRPRQRDITPNYRTGRNNKFSPHSESSYPQNRGYEQRMRHRSSDPYRHRQDLNFKNKHYTNQYNSRNKFHKFQQPDHIISPHSRPPYTDKPQRMVAGPYRPPDRRAKKGRNQRTETIQARNESVYNDGFNNADTSVYRGPQRFKQQYHTKKRMTQHNTDFVPAPPKLKNTIKLMYQLIRLVHHMGKVTTKVEDNQPITFQRLTRLLINTVKPAFPGEQVNQLLEGNAKNWLYTTQLALEQHYESLIESTIKEIREQTDRADWSRAFEVASSWAEKNYGGKVNVDTLEQAEALITAELFEEETMPQPQSTGNQGPSSPRTYAQVAASRPPTATVAPPIRLQGPPSLIPPQVSVRPKKGVQHIEVQTSPTLLVRGHTEGPPPPPHRGDWSLDDDDEGQNPLDPEKIIRPIQGPSISPREQRTVRPGRVQIAPLDGALATSEKMQQRPVVNAASPPPQEGAPMEELDLSGEEDYNGEQLVLRSSDHSSPLNILLFSDTPDEPTQGLSPISRFLAEYDDTISSDAQQETAMEAEECVASTSHRIPQTRSKQTSSTKIPDRPHTDGSRNSGSAGSSDTTPSGGLDPWSEGRTENLPIAAPADETNTNVQTTGPDSPIARPTRHINTCKKMIDWTLTIEKKYVIIGDSNVSRLPALNCPDLQVDSYPGAKLQHAANLIEKATIRVQPEKIILSFGFNNRQQRYRIAAITELQKAHKAVTKRLPNTEVFFPLINFTRSLPLYEQIMIDHLNTHIKKNTSCIPPLPTEQFMVESDGIHWKASTAKAMLQHWKTHLNC